MRYMNFLPVIAVIALTMSCNKPDVKDPWPVIPEKDKAPVMVKSKETPGDVYREYETYTVRSIPGFSPKEPAKLDKYGGMESVQMDATGFFRVEKKDGRWWMVTPLGHPYLAASVGELSQGGSEREKQAMSSIFGTVPVWAASEMDWLRSIGFNSIGKGLTSTIKDIPGRLPYCIFTMPMYNYSRYMQTEKGYKVPSAMPILFEDNYEEYIDSQLSWLSMYANDPCCIGIFTDNELYWSKDMLKRYITDLPYSSKARKTAQEWLDARKGRSATAADITDEDIEAFLAYGLEEYYSRTLAVLRQYDPNHMFIGERFYSWVTDLTLPSMMQTAGKYMDVVSLNHYTKWTPDQEDLARWEQLSGRPILITEFYVKGEDSGLPNNAGLGWVVPTQKDRGLFYQNFVLSLIKSGKCVGWSWFKYQDNDPEDSTADASNTDSNKGLVTWNFERYDEMISLMSEMNAQIYNLAEFYNNPQ